MHTLTEGPSAQLTWVRPTHPGAQVIGHQSYHPWWLMGANLIVNDPELAPVDSPAGTLIIIKNFFKKPRPSIFGYINGEE